MPQDRTLTETAQVYVAGDVVVAPDVTIAPGAVLQANPGSRLVIEARVCIGAQVVIQAYGGELNLQAGVNVGPGGLLLGQGRIGENACIGAESTLIHPQVAAAAVVPAHSLWGDPRDRGQSSSTASEPHGQRPTAANSGLKGHVGMNGHGHGAATVKTHGRQTSVNSTADGTPGESSSTLEAASIPDAAGPLDTNGAGVLATHTVIYGREQVTQLIATLFPHRRPLTSSDETSSS
jgi:carbon dioxide concentrating mechanism protein CcmN